MCGKKNDTSGLAVKQPLSIWHTPLKFDARGLFTNLSSATISAATGNWAATGKSVMSGLTSIGLKKGPSGKAWLLIHRGMTSAVFDLVQHYEDLIGDNLQPSQALENLVQEIDDAEFLLDESFFSQPQNSTLVNV